MHRGGGGRAAAALLPVLLVLLAGAACSSSTTHEGTTTSRSLARRLDAAKLCVRVQRAPAAERAQLAAVDMSGVWQCVMRRPSDGSSGATEVTIWVAADRRSKEQALGRVLAAYRAACAGPDGTTASGSSDGTGSISATPPEVTLRYLEGGRWLAFVGINARLRPVAAVLDGRVVVKQCGADPATGK
jgi:hypothetical protein